jgi:hypothetical protein
MNNVPDYITTTKFRLRRIPFFFGIHLVILLSIAVTACNTPYRTLVKSYKQLSHEEQAIADSLFTTALDHEALYTLCDTLKPISSVKMYRLPLLSTNQLQVDSANQALTTLQKTINRLNGGDWQFILNPFERSDSIYKNIELYVIRKSRMASVIALHQTFYSRLGILPNTNPATVLAITEYENKYDRWRSYGYLFGYPDYAVDFFVQAGKSQDSTKEFVQRNFFAIPVYAGESGYFTYAMPKDYQTTQTDSLMYTKAVSTLEKYKSVRASFYHKQNRSAVKLWKRLLK